MNQMNQRSQKNPQLLFLGTGAAWGLPEVNCDCLICRELRRLGESRDRSAILLTAGTRLLLDCGPDIRHQLLRSRVDRIDAVLISHEHGDHFLGLDDLFAYKRNLPRDAYTAVPVCLTPESREVISRRFDYLEALGVIRFREVQSGQWFRQGDFSVFPFRTAHGTFAHGAVGFALRFGQPGEEKLLVYTSDFMDLPEIPAELLEADCLIIQSFWLNEPKENRPQHMSFQRALGFIEALRPRGRVFLVHMGDGDRVPGDPANVYAKKYEARDPLRRPGGGEPYPVPLNHRQWQETVDLILRDRSLPYRVTVAHDGLRVDL